MKYTYLMFDGVYFKIGESVNPLNRLSQLRTANPKIEMVCYGFGVSEKELHKLFKNKNIGLEWFFLDVIDVHFIQSAMIKYFTNENINVLSYDDYINKFKEQFVY